MTNLLKQNIHFEWDALCENTFEKLKECLVNPPILQYPNYEKEFILSTDASGVAIGAVLSQEQEPDGIDLPITYVSRILNKAEKNYPVIERELLAIVWAVKRFRPY